MAEADLIQTLDALRKRRIDAVYVENSQQAREEVLKLVNSGDSVGIGGSMTIQELGLNEVLKEKGCQVIWHWYCEPEEMMEVRKEATRARFYLSSTNAITRDGCLVNIDGIGNRVTGMVYGPETSVVIAGKNKVVSDLEEARQRIKNKACPLNAQRLNLDTPCAVKGECVDCNQQTRMCNIMTIIEGKPMLTNMTVILVGENLGY